MNGFGKALMIGLLASGFAAPLASADEHKHDAAGAAAAGGQGQTIGQHTMKATVEDVDTKTGIVDVKTEVGELKLHFPPQAAAKLKKGEDIQVQLGYQPAKAKGAGAEGSGGSE